MTGPAGCVPNATPASCGTQLQLRAERNAQLRAERNEKGRSVQYPPGHTPDRGVAR